jgi:hypothetical protein
MATRKKINSQEDSDPEQLLDAAGDPPDDLDAAVSESDDDFLDDYNLKSWLDDSQAQEYGYRFLLYEWRDRKKWLVREYHNEVPSKHDIGIEYGPGEYRALLVTNHPRRKSKIKTIYINISRHYAKLRESPATTQAVAVAAPPQSSDLANALLILEKLGPLLNNRQSPMMDLTQAAMAQFQMMQEVIKASMRENLSLMRSLMRREREEFEEQDDETDAADEPEESGTDDMRLRPKETTTGGSLWTTILPLLDTWVPKLIGDGIESQTVIALIKSLPQFKAVLSDNETSLKLVEELKNRVGVDETRKILAKLGVSL